MPSKIAADSTFIIFTFKENKAWCFMWILCQAEDSPEISSIILSEKTMKKYSRLSSAAVVIGALRVKAVQAMQVD